MDATLPSSRPLPALRDYRDTLRGTDIVVCGCGPSLLELPRPHDLLTIGVNDVGRLFDPTYLVVLNPRQQFKSDRYAFVERSNAQVLFTQLELGAVRPPGTTAGYDVTWGTWPRSSTRCGR